MKTTDLNDNDITIVESIMDILESNEDSIEENYNNKEDLVSLNNDLKIKIIDFLKTVDTSSDKKELVKLAIREYFELEDRDIIVVREKQIIIKLLDEQSIHEVTEEEKGTIANRYNGINEDDLNSFYHDIFLQEENEDFFYFVAEHFVNEYLIRKRLDNKTFEKNVFPIIQSIITKELTNNFDHNEDFFKGFSGFVFRKHFKDVFSFVAELMLNKLAESNDYIIGFLKYYSLSVVIVNGKRYKVPVIEAEDGWKWNVASMMPVIKVFIRASIAVDKLELEIESLKEKTLKYNVNGISPVMFNNNLNKEMNGLRQEISYMAQKLDNHIITLKDDPTNDKLKRDITNIRQQLQDFRKDLKVSSDNLVPKDHILKYTNLKRDLDSKVRHKEREEIMMEKNEKSFLSISDALVKALTSKKVLIS